jgi:hypothetical protein
MRFFDSSDADGDGRLSMAEVVAYDAAAVRRFAATWNVTPSRVK